MVRYGTAGQVRSDEVSLREVWFGAAGVVSKGLFWYGMLCLGRRGWVG